MPDYELVIQSPPVLAVTIEQPVELAVTMTAGQGPSGPAASGLVRSVTVPIGGLRVVVSIAGTIAYADASNSAHLGRVVGLTLNAASPGGTVEIRVDGEVEEGSWSWTVDQPVYLGTNGLLTQTLPVAGSSYFQQKLGFAVSPTRVFLLLETPIIL